MKEGQKEQKSHTDNVLRIEINKKIDIPKKKSYVDIISSASSESSSYIEEVPLRTQNVEAIKTTKTKAQNRDQEDND